MPLLTARQERFCQEYLVDLNATQAAIRAGYSANTANREGCRLMTNVDIRARIAELQSKRAQRVQITQDQVLAEYAKLAFVNMQDYIAVQDDGSAYVDLSSLTREQAAAIQEVTTEEYVEGRGEASRNVKRVRIKLADKKGALDSLARHLGMFVDKDNQPADARPVVQVFIRDAGLPPKPVAPEPVKQLPPVKPAGPVLPTIYVRDY